MDMGDEVAATMEVDEPMQLPVAAAGPGRRPDRAAALGSRQASGDGERRPMDRLGLTHLCIRVDDVEDLVDARWPRAAGAPPDPVRARGHGSGRRPGRAHVPDGPRRHPGRADVGHAGPERPAGRLRRCRSASGGTAPAGGDRGRRDRRSAGGAVRATAQGGAGAPEGGAAGRGGRRKKEAEHQDLGAGQGRGRRPGEGAAPATGWPRRDRRRRRRLQGGPRRAHRVRDRCSPTLGRPPTKPPPTSTPSPTPRTSDPF